MLDKLRRLLPTQPTMSEPEKRQALLRYVVVLLLLPGTITATYHLFSWLLVRNPTSPINMVLSLTGHPVMALCYWLAWRGKLKAAYYVPPICIVVGATVMLWTIGPSVWLMLLFVLAIFVSGVLLGPAQSVSIAAFSITVYTFLGWFASLRLPNPVPTSMLIVQDLVLVAFGVGMMVLLIILEKRTATRLRRENLDLEKRVTQQTAVLKINEQRSRAIFQNMPVPSFAWRCIGDQFRLVDYNKAALAQTHGGVAHYLGVEATKHYADRPDILDDLRRCYVEQSQFTREITYEFQRAVASCELRATYTFIAPDTILVHTEDVTETKRAQVALRDSERRMRNLLSSIPGMSYRCLNDDTWTMTFVSEGCQALTGYAPDELIDNRRVAYTDMVHPADLARIQASGGSQGLREGEFAVTYRIHTAQGETKWVWDQGLYIKDDEGNEIAQEGLILDITETHRAQDDLRASEARNRQLVEAYPDGIFVTDGSVNILGTNGAAMATLGYENDTSLIGWSFYDLIKEEDRPRARYNTTHGVGMEPTQIAEYEMVRADGTMFPAEVAATLVHDFQGQGAAFIIYARDVTSRHHLQQQLQAALKLEAVGRLAGGIAHDFNNLLTVINGYASFLADSLTDDEESQQDAMEVLRAGQRAAHLTRQLLAFSRRQVMQTEVLSVNDIVEDIQPMLQSLIGERIILECDLDIELPNALVDRAQIECAITNLVTNGRDAMPNGGTLRIQTRAVRLLEPIESIPDTISEGEYILLSVIDSGIGMTEAVRERALEPFYTTKEVGQGTGLGLSMVYGTIRQLDGALRIESDPGHGTSVLLYLPVSVDATDQRSVDAPAAFLLQGDETILLVEDEKTVREYVSRALTQLGYRILTADSGERAIEIMRDNDEPITMLLSDVVMPGMNGPELAENIEQIRPIPHTLFMSGHSPQTIQQMGLDVPDVQLIRKPFSPFDLAQRIRFVMDR